MADPTPKQHAPKGLTAKQQRFIAEYLIDLNATQAAIRAGYSSATASSAGHGLLRKLEIADAVVEGKRAQLASSGLSAMGVLEELRRLAHSDVGDVFDATGSLLPVAQIPLETRCAIAGIEVVIKNAQAGDGHTDTVHKIKFWDKGRALELLAKHLGLLVEKVEHSGGVELTWKD